MNNLAKKPVFVEQTKKGKRKKVSRNSTRTLLYILIVNMVYSSSCNNF